MLFLLLAGTTALAQSAAKWDKAVSSLLFDVRPTPQRAAMLEQFSADKRLRKEVVSSENGFELPQPHFKFYFSKHPLFRFAADSGFISLDTASTLPYPVPKKDVYGTTVRIAMDFSDTASMMQAYREVTAYLHPYKKPFVDNGAPPPPSPPGVWEQSATFHHPRGTGVREIFVVAMQTPAELMPGPKGGPALHHRITVRFHRWMD
jgi:hypothetical protein